MTILMQNKVEIKRFSAACIKDAVLPDPVRAYERAGLNTGKPRHSGAVWQTQCPLHADGQSPSFSIYPDGNFHCFGCAAHGDIIAFYQHLHSVDFQTACERLGDLLAVPLTDHPQTLTRPLSPPVTHPPDLPPIPGSIIETCHNRLMHDAKRLSWLTGKKALPMGVIRDARLGVGNGLAWRGLRFTIPVADIHDGEIYRDIRGYSPKCDPKTLPYEKGRGSARLFAWSWVCGQHPHINNDFIWCEGEIDALNLIGRGIPAVTATCGAGGAVAKSLQLPDLTGKKFRLLFDADDAGRKAAHDLSDRLADAGASRVSILDWPAEVPRGFDISDYFASGGDLEGLGI